MQIRIAVLFRDRCQPKKCTQECIFYCPRVRAGVVDTIHMGDRGKPVISEDLCIGCGICVHKCPFDAIHIVRLPGELSSEVIHQYGPNGFRLFRLPFLSSEKIVGILGSNGIGKTTVLNILSGHLIPNLGDIGRGEWDPVIERFRGTSLHDHFRRLSQDRIRTSVKPQYVDRLPRHYSGEVGDLLKHVDETGRYDEVIELLNLKDVVRCDIRHLSGGELQRTAIGATMMKDADVYFFDEPSSYLDIQQRLNAARSIRELVHRGKVLIIEHDLAVLDFLADQVHIMYGREGVFGVVSVVRSVRNAINTYLMGYLKEDNVRFRDESIVFETHPPRMEWTSPEIAEFGPLVKRYNGFELRAERGVIHQGEVVGVVGPNATGKTTFVRVLAGELAPTEGVVRSTVSVSYKPQYITPTFDGSTEEYLHAELGDDADDQFFKAEIEAPLSLEMLYRKALMDLSGGEIQRVAIAVCLGMDADLYLLDEPSAYLDSNQRMIAARTIRRVIEKRGRSALVVDHDIYFIDMISDSILVFSGTPSVEGHARGPFSLREGMNLFLKTMDITFRRDTETKRPRINKMGSKKDREQKASGEYYYVSVD